MTAIEYLKRFRPQELVRCGTGEYQLQSHDSFKINEESSVWHWKSRDIGGKSALDYLIHVEQMPFLQAVEEVLNAGTCTYYPVIHEKQQKVFVLPPRAPNEDRIRKYLMGRGISSTVIETCVRSEILYESLPYHNCVFVGRDEAGVARYAALRGTFSGEHSFKGEQSGSDKRFSFCIHPPGGSVRLAIYEAAIDALAHWTLEGENDKFRLSLGGIYAPAKEQDALCMTRFKTPAALDSFFSTHPEIKELEICFDNDYAGRWAALRICEAYKNRCRVVVNLPRQEGFDYGDLAAQRIGMKKNRQEEFVAR